MIGPALTDGNDAHLTVNISARAVVAADEFTFIGFIDMMTAG